VLTARTPSSVAWEQWGCGVGGGRSLATPGDPPLHDCSTNSHVYVHRESLGFIIVQGPFSVAVPNPSSLIRNCFRRCTVMYLCSGGHAVGAGLKRGGSVDDGLHIVQ
jgi:hypothetical protein